MSRIRTVKPELFRHEDLFDAEFASGLPLRLAFIGLFTVADCEGRFPWKPRTLKLDVLPHDNVDFSAVLNALEAGGFIKSYLVDGQRYGYIPSFAKHQQIPAREAERGSAFPPPPLAAKTETNVESRTEHEPVHVESRTEHEPVHVESRTEHEPESQEGEGEEEREGKRKGRERKNAPALKTPFPADFAITPELQAWATGHGYGDLEAHLGNFRDKAKAKGYQYADWQAAFRNAVRDDWANIRASPAGTPRNGQRHGPPPTLTPEGSEFECILQSLNTRQVIEGECSHAGH